MSSAVYWSKFCLYKTTKFPNQLPVEQKTICGKQSIHVLNGGIYHEGYRKPHLQKEKRLVNSIFSFCIHFFKSSPSLYLYQATKIRPVKIERISRCNMIGFASKRVCHQERKECWFPAFSFSKIVFKSFFFLRDF